MPEAQKGWGASFTEYLREQGSMQRDFVKGVAGGLFQREVSAGFSASVGQGIGAGARNMFGGAAGIGGFAGRGAGGLAGAFLKGSVMLPRDAVVGAWKLRAAAKENFIARRAAALAEGGKGITFSTRTFGEHLAKGAKNYAKYGLLSPQSLGINFLLAASTTGDNPMDPNTGLARAFAGSVGAEAGFMGGSTIGAALLAATLPGVGFLAGGVLGAMGGEAVFDLPFKAAEFGYKYGPMSAMRKSSFIDSEEAATMRQRAMQSIRRNQLNARSSLGSEALAYHA